MLAKKEVAEAFEPGDHGTTFGGNALACSAGIAVLNTLMEEKLIEECAIKGDHFKMKLNSLKDSFPQ